MTLEVERCKRDGVSLGGSLGDKDDILLGEHDRVGCKQHAKRELSVSVENVMYNDEELVSS